MQNMVVSILDLPMKGVDKIIESCTREFQYLKQGQLLIGS
jgi:hypothetical protein